MELINLHLESLIYSSIQQENLLKELTQYFKCGVKLSEKNVEFGENFVELIGELLTDDFGMNLFESFRVLFYYFNVYLQFIQQNIQF